MFEPIQIAPSILSADFMNMERDIHMLEAGGAGYIHVDVMDGHFVPNLTLGVPFVSQLKKITDLPLDVHLMISNPLTQVPWFLDAGADIVTVHLEVLDAQAGEVDQVIDMIHEAGVKAALSLNPDTDTEKLRPYLGKLDMVLLMSVFPGFSGQSFIEGTEDRVAHVAAMAREAGVSPLIQVDGGIGVATVARVAREGADVFVCGNAVLKAPDSCAAIQEITGIANAAAAERMA
ncbi:MAG: ribulose-phosphate 3-epimerase [Raoultibacter sp.]